MDFAWGIAVGSLLFGGMYMHWMSKDHRAVLEMLKHHEDWLRAKVDEVDSDEADWWKSQL